MSKTIRRMMTLLLVLSVLCSLAAPALAVGEEETAAKTASEETVPETKAEETVSETAAEEKTTASEEQQAKKEGEKPAETKKPETSIAKTEEKKEGPAGSITATDEKKASAPVVPATREVFVSEKGSDEGDGSREKPFATLAKAAEAANGATENTVYIVLLSNLKVKETARIYGKNVILTSDGEEAFTVTREADFAAAEDKVRGSYNPAMIEVGTLEERSPEEAKATQFAIENAILDDAGLHEGSEYAAQTLNPENKEQNLANVQDAVVAVYGNAALALKDGAQILNYGGLSAVRAAGDATITLENGSEIKDTQVIDPQEGLKAIAAENENGVTIAEYAKVLDHGAETEEAETEEKKDPAEENEKKTEEEIAQEEALYAAAQPMLAATRDSAEGGSDSDLSQLIDQISKIAGGLPFDTEALTDLLSTFKINNISDIFDRLNDATSNFSESWNAFWDAVPGGGGSSISEFGKITLTYDDNGGSGGPGSEKKDASILGTRFEISAVEPSRQYYSFLGWAQAADAAEAEYHKGDSLTLLTDKTIYAVWEKAKYTLTFDANGGKGAPEAQSGVCDEKGSVKFTIPETKPTRTGYTFLGWAKTSNATMPAYFPGREITITGGNQTLYAVWQKNTGGNSLSFEGDPAELVEVIDLKDGSYSVTYTTTLNLSTLFSVLNLGSLTVDAAAINIRLTMDTEQDPARLVPYVNSVEVSAEELNVNPTVTGNVLDIELSGQNVSGSVFTKPIVLTCKGILPDDQFDATPGKNVLVTTAELTSASVTIGEQEYKPSSSSVIGQALSAETEMCKSAVLVYDPNGGKGGPEGGYVPAKTGYALDTANAPTHDAVNGRPVVFIGWTKEADPTIYEYGSTAPATITTVDIGEGEEVTVYAVYGYDDLVEDGTADVLQEFLTLKYDDNGGSGGPGEEKSVATVVAGIKTAKFIISTTEPKRQYYTFQGWAEKADATEAKYRNKEGSTLDDDLIIHEDTTLYAVWVMNPEYKLSFDANGGTGAPSTQKGYSDENGAVPLTIPATKPTRTGYTFLGWGTSRVSSATYQPGDKVTIRNGDVTLYAVWQRGSSSGVRTGDDSNPRLYAAAALTSLWGMMGIVYVLGRKPKKDKK